jgi:outer membrane receptor for ferrienterochelin and colicins
MSKNVILIFFFGLINLSHAQSKILLTLLAKENSKPVASATITIICNKTKTIFVANKLGLAEIINPISTCKVNISAVGFDPLFNIAITKDTTIFLEKKNASINEVIITGQAKKILAQQSIYKISTISAATIKQQAAVTLADVLGNEMSFNKQQDNILGSNINLMGIGGQNIKILINGAPINGRENGNIDLNQINIANAERIEIVKGPMSVLYGSDALGGVINIITKAANKTSGFVYTYLESINKINLNANISFVQKQQGINFNFARNLFAGYTYIDTFERALSWKPKVQYMADVNYTTSYKKLKLSFAPNFMWEKLVNKGTPIVDPFSATAIDENYVTKRFSNTMIADINLNEKNKITFSNSISVYNRIRTKINADLVNKEYTIITANGSLDTSTFIDYNARGFVSKEFNKNLTLFYGYDINSEYATSLKLLNRKQNITDIACFFSAPFTIIPKLQIQPALRFSYNTQYEVPIVPSLNIRKEFTKNIIARASYAQGFRAPSLKEMYLQFVDINHNVIGNSNLKPEQSTHLQASVEMPLQISKTNRINFMFANYYNNIINQIALAAVPNTLNQYQYTNVGLFKNIAQEVKVNFTSKKLKTTIGVSINNILKTDSTKAFSNWEFNARANYLISKHNTSFNINYRYLSKQALLSVATFGNGSFGNAYIPHQHLADANITQQFFKNKMEMQLGVKNIFNVKSLSVIGATNNGIHSQGNTQLVSPNRSVFLMMKYFF